MLKRANINWTAKQLSKMEQNGKITFDNVVQRGYVWDVKRSSLLIHSMIEGYPVPPFYAVKSEEKYDMLDGKQRCKTISSFIRGEFALEDVPEIEVEDADGNIELIDINGMKFEEFEEDIQDLVAGYSLTLYYFDDINEDQVAEMFFRLNNGKPLSAIELTRAKAKSMTTIKEIGQHELFKNSLTEKAMSRYTNEDIVIKSYAMLHEENPSMETKVMRPLMAEAELNEDDKKQLIEVFDRVLTAHGLIKDAKVAKRLLTRTHLISLVPMIWKSLQDGLSDNQVAEWVTAFLSGGKSASVSVIYNENAGSGSARKEAVRKRLDEVCKHYTEFFR